MIVEPPSQPLTQTHLPNIPGLSQNYVKELGRQIRQGIDNRRNKRDLNIWSTHDSLHPW